MGETARPEPVDHRLRLIPIVADNEPTEQCTIIVRECGRCALDRTAHPVRCDSNRTTLVNVARPVEVKFADNVLPRNPTSPLRIELRAPTAHRDPLAATPFTNT